MLSAVAIWRIHSGLRALLACIVFLGLIASIVSPAFAAGGQTGTLSGTVIDHATNQPIAGATISAASPSGSYSAKTGANGTFIIVGVNVDTYAISISAPGFDTYVLRGATVVGDQPLNVPVQLSKTQAVIGRVGARSATGAFQPTSTVDQYTISGARLAQTTGSPANNSLNDVVLSAPGVSLTDTGIPTIRGGGQREVGYQFDGIPYTDPFVGGNGGDGLTNGVGSVQVVEGSGDAGQGGIGAGVINVIPKRGTYPAFGSVTLQLGGPNFNNSAIGEYGFATADGSISNYASFSYQAFDPYYGFHGQGAAAYGTYFLASKIQNNQFVDNFVYKFGSSKNQSLQVLYSNTQQWQWGNNGGVPPGVFDPITNPTALPFYPYDTLAGNPGAGAALAPFTPSSNVAVGGPELTNSIQTRLLKFEYDNTISSSTFLAVRYYNWEKLDYNSDLYSLGAAQQSNPVYQVQGGPVAGGNFDFTHAFSDKMTVTLNGSYEKVSPIWNDVQPLFSADTSLIGDFGPPTATNPCPYVSCQEGLGNVPIPSPLINYNNSFFQNYGIGLRFQYVPTEKLHLDFGVRYEGQNQHWFNPNNPGGILNPYDIPTQLWNPIYTNPNVWEPRMAVNYLFDPADSLRVSYGRTAVFQNGQTAGTPFGMYGANTALAALPPNLAGATPLIAGAPVANQCGTTLNGAAGLFPCQNYEQQLYWSYDRALDAPDIGGVLPAVYTNYDASFGHEFAGGYAVKLTPYYKWGVNLPSFSLLKTLPGGNQIFSAGSQGVNKTTGINLDITTPDRPVGLAGFLSAGYVNVLTTSPPLSNGEFNGAPLLSVATLALGNLYRAGYISPAQVRFGATYTTKDGFSITPIVQINSGYPYDVGNTIAAGFGPGATCPCANVPQVNFGSGTPILVGYQNAVGAALNTNYFDPAYSGSQAAPNIAATRGTPGSAASGGVTWYPNVQFNLTLQYKHGRDTIGIQMVNLFTNGYNNAIPEVSPFYQPVANGLAGPQTGQNTCTATYGVARGCAAVNPNSYAFTNGAYLLSNGALSTASFYLAPLSPTQFNIFYKRQL
jgi:hypothetical protein